jgi:hypothetical protein
MPNYSSPRYYRWFSQKQTAATQFNNTAGAWTPTGAQMLRVDEGSVTRTRNAPYSRFPVLTGTRSEVAGIRGRKGVTWSIRGVPIIPSGAAGTLPDLDHLFGCAFGAYGTIVASTSVSYNLVDSGMLPFSLFGFTHGVSTLTNQAIWGCGISRITLNFNGAFLTADFDGFGGDMIDNNGFSAFSIYDAGGLTAFPTEPPSPTVNGQPIAGFGNGYTTTIHSQEISLKVRSRSITWETGLEPVQDVEGSTHLVEMVGGTRRLSMAFTALDDDSTALNDIKAQCDTDGATISMTSVSGTVPGSIVTCNLNNIQPNSFGIKDSGNMVDFEFQQSYAHASSISTVNDFTMVFT